jgi:hypothetical protein
LIILIILGEEYNLTKNYVGEINGCTEMVAIICSRVYNFGDKDLLITIINGFFIQFDDILVKHLRQLILTAILSILSWILRMPLFSFYSAVLDHRK